MILWHLLYSRFFFLPSISTPAGSESQVWINICCVLEANLKALLVFEPGCASITWMDSLNKKKHFMDMVTHDEQSRFSALTCGFVLQQFWQAVFSASKVSGADTRLFQKCAVPVEPLWQVVVVQEKRRYPGDVHLAWERSHWDNLLQPVTLL